MSKPPHHPVDRPFDVAFTYYLAPLNAESMTAAVPLFVLPRARVLQLAADVQATDRARAALLDVLVARAADLARATPCPECGEPLRHYYNDPAACILCHACGWHELDYIERARREGEETNR